MPSFKIAHIREQGIDLIIIPLDSSFGTKPQQDQKNLIDELQMRSTAAGLSGTVIPVWDGGGGRMAFIAQPNWHAYFKSINLPYVWANVNGEIRW